MTRRVLAIFAKAPIAGRVKSRLAAEVGASQALQAHVELTELALARLSDLSGMESQLWLSEHHTAGERWARQYGVVLLLQSGGDLGMRMRNAFADLFEQGADSVLLVGTDLPVLDADYIQRAQKALADVPAVIGPTEDGGYGLIGLTASGFQGTQAVFETIAWGTGDVLVQTRQRLQLAGCDWRELNTLWDVDTAADWQRYLSLRADENKR